MCILFKWSISKDYSKWFKWSKVLHTLLSNALCIASLRSIVSYRIASWFGPQAPCPSSIRISLEKIIHIFHHLLRVFNHRYKHTHMPIYVCFICILQIRTHIEMHTRLYSAIKCIWWSDLVMRIKSTDRMKKIETEFIYRGGNSSEKNQNECNSFLSVLLFLTDG